MDVPIVAILYFQYREKGSPYGATLDGFQRWVDESVMLPFEALARNHEPTIRTEGGVSPQTERREPTETQGCPQPYES